jgi:hypothetical protein
VYMFVISKKHKLLFSSICISVIFIKIFVFLNCMSSGVV